MPCANTGPAIANVSATAEKIIVARFIFMDLLRPLVSTTVVMAGFTNLASYEKRFACHFT